MNDEKKARKGGFVSDAQELLRRLNARGDESRLTVKRPVKQTDEDPVSPAEQETIGTPTDAVLDSISADVELTDDELRELFDHYCGDTPEPGAPITYATPDELNGAAIVDVEKNIDEAEKYVDALAERVGNTADASAMLAVSEDTTGGFAVDVSDTRQLNAFSPNMEDEDDPSMKAETRVVQAATDDVPVPEIPSDTEMMKAFGLNPKRDATAETRFFEELSLEDDEDLYADGEDLAKDPPADESVSDEIKEERFEYTDPSQNKAIIASFKSQYTFMKVRVVLAASLALLLGLLENIRPIADIFGGNVNVIAVDWVLAVLCATLVVDRMIPAAKKLRRFELDCDTVTLFSFALSIITTGITLFTAPADEPVCLYNFTFAVCVLLNSLMTFITLRRDVYSFKVISFPRPKSTLSRVKEGEPLPEEADFSEYLGEGEEVCTIRNGDFVTSYFAHREDKTASKILIKVFLPECLLFSVLFFLVSLLVMDHSAVQSLGAGYASFMMCVPLASFLCYCYPHYLASGRAYTYNSAIIGDKTYENYEQTSIVAFRDEDAFPVGRVKVRGLKLYADRKIESVMYYASSIYSGIGGPLATVFRQATLNSVISQDVEMREVSREGVSAMVDGKNVVIGTPAYMESQCFEIMPDKGDEEYAGKNNNRILYLACEQIVIAKFYIRYTTTSEFLYMASHLAAMGVGTAIRTADPCIDDGLLYANNLSPEQYPVRVMKGVLPAEKTPTVSAMDGGIVSVGTTKELIKTFLLCDKVENVRRINFVLTAVSSVLGTAVMFLLLFTGHLTGLISVFPALYQLFWLLPVCVISKLYI